ncbi:MAG: YsnF/AvaK domain-containing protein, partial [Actinomycetota bacterium]
MPSTVVGFFDQFSEARSAVEDLIASGVPRDDVSITSSNATGEHDEFSAHETGNRSGSGAATGAGVGAVVGGIGGLLVGLGLLTIPGIGPILAAGPLATAAAGAVAGAATGGLLGALVGMGIPEEDAHTYAEGVRRGGTLVTVNADDAQLDTVSTILNRHGAVDIDRRAADWRGRGWTGFQHDAQPLGREDVTREREFAVAGRANPAASAQENEIRVPVTEEEIAVGKRAVQRGGVRIYKRTEEQPFREDVQLREEHVTVDRHAVDRPVTGGDQELFQERVYEMREMAEEPVVAKQARVAEEVVIRKDVDQRTETIEDTVRRTDVDVQPVRAADAGYSAWDDEFRRDYTSRYAGQDDYATYAPAYRYGYDVGNDQRYAGRDWREIEPNIRSDWETRSAGTWDRFKDSIRH